MKKSFCFALFGLLILLLCAPLALADEGIDSSWYYGGADGAYALKTREYESGFSYTPSPDDWRDRNIYQLFTDRFASDGTCNLDSYHPEWFYKNSCTSSGGIPRNFHQGGNWRGLRQQIGYLAGMGVTAVWISGVQLNDQAVKYGGSKEWRWTPYHQYHVDNFFSCDPASGTFQELKDLIDDLHAAGIAVILDVAPNHMCDKCGRQGNNGNDDKYYTDSEDGWWWDSNNTHPAPFDDLARFHRNGTINNWDTSPENLKGQFKGTDDLKQEDDTTSSLLYKAFKNLIDATDCDGFRVDAIKHIPYDWCRNWAQAMRDHAAYRGKNNFLVFGELFSYSHDALAGWCSDGYGFNSSLDFPLMNAMKAAFGNGYNLGDLGNEMYTIANKYGKAANNVIAFLDNHDVDRFACTYGGDSKATAANIMRPAMTFLYLAPPIPLLYYGTEHCFNQERHGNGIDRNGDESSGWYNPDDSDWQRECMFSPNAMWGTQNGFEVGNAYGDMFSDGAKEAGLYYHIAWLNGLRNKSRALRRGGFQQRASVGGQGLYAFTKWYGDEVALVLLNTSDSAYSVSSYNSGWLEVGIQNAEFKENGTGEVVGSSNGEGWIDLSGVTLDGKGSKVFICNFADNSSDVYGSGGGSAETLWVRNTYGWPTENATLADTIYINTEAGNADNVTEVEVFYKVNPKEGEVWPGTNMVVNAEWDSEKGKWWHLEVPASDLDVGELQYCVCVRDANGNEVWDNNGGGNYVLQILPRPADIGATFASVAASPTAPTNGETATITAAMAKTGNDISQLAVKMSYAFETISGAVGTWTTVSMTKGSTYEDKTYFTASVENLPGGQTLLYKLEATNGGTDTLQANNGNAYRLKVAGDSTGTVGNCWHCPTNHEPPEAFGCMRQSVTPKAGGKVTLWMGNYQGGDGTSGQPDPFDMTGGKVNYRFGAGDTWSAWESKGLDWACRGGDNNFNNYWSNTNNLITVPASAEGQYLQYYFEVYYTNSTALATPTYLYMNPDNSGTSLTTTSEATAQETPFEVGIAANASGDEPGFIRHAGNLTRVADNKVQIWARIGYQPDSGDAWADEAVIRYRVDVKKESGRSSGVKALSSKKARTAKSWKALTNQVSMTLQSTENDSSGKGKVMVWMGPIEDDLIADPDSILIYEVYARNSKGNGNWKQAEYNAENGSCTFEYRMWSDGSGDLTVDGVPADYTTSKFFLDEADTNDEITVEVEYHAPDDADIVELFTNFGRRDHADDDTDGDGWPDGMIPPDGGKVTAADTYLADAGYWQAVPMTKGSGAYVKKLSTKKCGVYRITARYGYVQNGVTNWTWYSQNPDPEGAARRDHVVVISPKKAMQQTMYELNVLTTKATADTEAGCGTFEGLSERLRPAATADADPYGEFSIDYLNRMGVNCLWFQPIHPNLDYARGNTNSAGTRYKPGSPYGTKNYFSVNANMSTAKTEAGAVAAFIDFVQKCDKAQSKAGETKNLDTINVMLDGVMNHTSFDAVFGEGYALATNGLGAKAIAELDAAASDWKTIKATDTIPATKIGIQWYSHVVDDTHNQADPATRYVSVDDNDIANAPERYDFGKWNDVAELLYGDYSTMVKYNDMEEKWYQGDDGNWYSYTEMGTETSRIYSEEDQYYYGSMLPATKLLWKYMASYPEYWLKKTGNDGVNHPGVRDADGTLTDDYGIDGLRCDYAQGLPNQFWEYTINRTRSMKWNFLFMAESLDGGKVGFRSNRQFDILNENMVFRFTQDHVSDPWQFQNELENRRNSYGNGLILLNLTCHDEIIPWGDPQATASRYAMVSAVDGIPMIFFGQEQSISTFDLNEGHDPDNGNKWVGFKKFESNFGKWIPHFKVWNKMLVWDDMVYSNGTPNASRDMAAFYGKINLARQKSPALQSRNRWFLNSDKNGNYIKKLMFCAKWEDAGKSPKEQDAVFAVALFLNDSMGENNELNGHWGEGATYDISPFAANMGIENRADRFYNLKNIASTNDAYVWEEAKSGKELYTDGLEVVLEGSWQWDNVNQKTNELACSVWNDNGRVVQYLKVFDVTDEVPIVAPDGLTITDPTETAEVPFGTASYDVVGMAGDDIDGKVAWSNAANGATGSFDPATVWTNAVTLAEGTNVVTFTAATKAAADSYAVLASVSGTNSVSGFGDFVDASSAGQAGWFVHTSVGDAGLTGFTGNAAYGMWANLGYNSEATRTFSDAANLVSASVDVGMRWDSNIEGSYKGIEFMNASGTPIFGVQMSNSATVVYYGMGGNGTWSTEYGEQAFTVTLTKTSTGYAVTGTTRTGGTVSGITVTTSDAIASFKAYMNGVAEEWSDEAGMNLKDNRQLYFDNLRYSVESSGTGEPATATATIVVLPDAHADDIEVEIVAVPEISFDAKTGKITVSLDVEGEGVEALQTIPVWTADTLVDGTWNWTVESAQIVNGELEFQHKMPTDKPLLISVGKPGCIE